MLCFKKDHNDDKGTLTITCNMFLHYILNEIVIFLLKPVSDAHCFLLLFSFDYRILNLISEKCDF